ncbi:DUF6745 domain-containing protein [Kitasatospora terrestris]|uniref:DUF6745 domain-containing protein n=1 Tax=Kitasatospora terrestris TaxID=258051 RepID=A0ABP9EQA5_9ACTN
MTGRTPAGRAPRTPLPDRLATALALREEWLRHGLAAAPADRPRAEAAVRELYALAGTPPPRFTWVDSPAAARPLLPGTRTPRFAETARLRPADWPLASRLAALQSALRERLDARVRGRPATTWGTPAPARQLARTQPPRAALAAGVDPDVLADVAVREALSGTLGDAVRGPLRTALLGTAASGTTWYGQHDAAWVGPYDVLARAGLARFDPDDLRLLGPWAELARSTGWWWPDATHCVLAERPAAVHTEPLAHAHHGERRLHRADGPAVRFADGAALYVVHGTPVPEWVVTGPTVELIHAEPNVEVRRCAIERLGWDAYIGLAGLRLLAEAPDPGNPGFRLRLYDLPREAAPVPARLLLAVNGSAEPDGRRRRYGLAVPPHFDDALAAAGWSYGLSGAQYATLVRRT